jgi:cobalt-zinc-cadmium efflux system outer membrane protein
MRASQRFWATGALLGLALAGCRTTPALPDELPSLPQPAGLTDAPPPAVHRASDEELPPHELSLDEIVALAVASHPDLAAARARADAARGRLIQAGLYPNPTVRWIGTQIGEKGAGSGEQGPLFTQTVVTGGKLRLARAAASHGVAAADWQAVTRWFDVVTRVRLAYFEALTARREVAASREVVRIAEEGLEAARKLQLAGAGTRPDVLRAQVELEQSRVRLEVARQRAVTADELLAVTAGRRVLPGGPRDFPLEGPVPEYAHDDLLEAILARSSEVQEALANVLQAEQLVARAVAERVPDLTLGARPFYGDADNTFRTGFEVGTAIPVCNRNQGNIHAAQADLARTRADVQSVELRLAERLAPAHQRYVNARRQARAFAEQILPNAQESLRLVRLGYESGDPKYDYTAVLQAQHTLVQARLTYVQVLGELWRAVSELAGLLQQEQLLPH